ncbi:MAG: hypothetical protein SPJ05_06920 [Candidatus Limisoma sp.]|nr:hypothetical protein [Candidatus Limisoma sp.]
MKKVFVLACMSLGAMSSVLTSHAQSIPNGGFDNWESAGTSLHTMSNKRTTQRPGEEPTSWNGSSVKLVGSKRVRVNKITEGDNTYVRIDNGKVGCTDAVQPWNGRLSLGETWASFYYEKILGVIYDVPNLDGPRAANKYAQAGSYDGMEFAYRPDAIRARVSRNNAGENYHIVAYIWNGSDFGDVPANLSYNNNEGYVKDWYSLENSDRVLMGKIAKTSGDAHVLASVDYTDNTAHDWKDVIIPLNYNSAYPADERPAKTNVIFCAGDPWDIQTAVDGNTLSVDDVNYVYYSRLDGVSFNGINVNEIVDFECDVYEYNLDIAYPDGYDNIAYTIKGQSLDKTVTIDPLWQQYRIDMTVTYTGGNGEGYDVDGKTSHTYTFYFDKLTSGVASLPESMAHVVATAGSVRISAFTGVAEVFSVDGSLVARSEIDGNGEIALAKGIYLVRTGTKTARVYVR